MQFFASCILAVLEPVLWIQTDISCWCSGLVADKLFTFPDEAKRTVTILVSDSGRFSENNAFQLLLIARKINFFEREGGQVITVRKNFIPKTNIL